MKDDYGYILNDAKYIIQDRPNANFVNGDNNKDKISKIFDKHKHEQDSSECK